MITADLRAEPEFSNVGKNQVARHMREMGLKCRATRKFVVTTDSKHDEPVAPNVLDLRAEPEFSNVGKNQVARHMREMGLQNTMNRWPLMYWIETLPFQSPIERGSAT
jgi:transposase InsO family protein